MIIMRNCRSQINQGHGQTSADRERQIDRQTERQRDREAERQREGETKEKERKKG